MTPTPTPLEQLALADELKTFLDRSTMNVKAEEFLRKVENSLRLAASPSSGATPAPADPLNWKLSDDAKLRIEEIDDNRRHAAINASNIVAGSDAPADDAAVATLSAETLRPILEKCASERTFSGITDAVERIQALLTTTNASSETEGGR